VQQLRAELDALLRTQNAGSSEGATLGSGSASGAEPGSNGPT